MAEENNKGAESVKIADLEFSEEFLKAENLAADGTVSKDQVEALKKKYEAFQAQSSSEGASVDTTKKTPEGNGTAAAGAQNPNGEEVQFISKDIQVDNENNWIDKYEAILKGYAEANNQEWKREEKDEEGKAVDGLKGSIGEAKFHFTDENKAIVNAEGINAIVALAKETGQEIAFNEAWSDEFKNKMLAACEAQGVTVQGRPEAQAEQANETPAPAQEDMYAVRPDIARVTLKRMIAGCEGDGKYTADAIAKLQAEGAKIGDNSKQGAQLAMCEYAVALSHNDAEKMQLLGEAMKKYGIKSVEREPDEEAGEIVITTKSYNSYTPEEKAKIDESVQKLQPKGRTSENAGNAGIGAAAVARANVSVNE